MTEVDLISTMQSDRPRLMAKEQETATPNAKAGKQTIPFRLGTRANANQHRVDEAPLPNSLK